MRRKQLGSLGIILVFLIALFVYPLESYITQPGGAYELAPLVDVVGGDKEEEGKFNMMTIAVTKATPFTYAFAKLSEFKKILPANNVRRAGENDKEYNIRQKKLMSDSQANAITVAFEKAALPVKYQFDGVFVSMVLPGGAADGVVEVGDVIRAVDGVQLEESGQFYSQIAPKKLGDSVTLTVDRNDSTQDVTVTMKEIPEDKEGRAGLGIRFEEDQTLITDPKVEISTSNIGGPSAGLMFTLEIMNQLLEEDLTKGYNIAGTGEMLEDGTVGRIGGADFKVVAADRQGIEIFFAPDDELPEEVRAENPGIKTNYEEAVIMAKKIGTKMKIVPVKTVDDALEYLDALDEKA